MELPAVGYGLAYRLEGSQLSGTGLIADGELIHLSFRKKVSDSPHRARQTVFGNRRSDLPVVWVLSSLRSSQCYLLEPHTLSKIVCGSAASPLLPKPGSSREQSENSLTAPSSAFICVICG